MQFEKSKHFIELLGEKFGFLLGAIVFMAIAFYVVGKAGVLCWSWNNFAKFIGSILSAYIIIEIIRRFSGKNANKIVY